MIQRRCPFCFVSFMVEANRANRADREGRRLFCSRRCSGLARRDFKSSEQKKAEKSEYDKQRRIEMGDDLRAAKRAAYYADHERSLALAAEQRKRRMPKHVEYCRRPEYVAKKREYDKQYRASEYGPFAEAYLLLRDLERELSAQATKYERMKQKGYFTRNAQKRRRELWQLMQRT